MRRACAIIFTYSTGTDALVLWSIIAVPSIGHFWKIVLCGDQNVSVVAKYAWVVKVFSYNPNLLGGCLYYFFSSSQAGEVI